MNFFFCQDCHQLKKKFDTAGELEKKLKNTEVTQADISKA